MIRSFNFKLIARLSGTLLLNLTAGMLLPLAVSLISRDGCQYSLGLSALLIMAFGLLLRNLLGKQAQYELDEDESYWITVVVWLVVPFCGAWPYLLVDNLGSFTHALFESVSGFTTTGSSVLARPEELPPSLLVYRAMTQWVGGLGLMLFVVALLRRLNLGAGRLYEAEFSGTQQRKLHPRLSSSVKRMWGIYSGLTIAMAVLLWIHRVPWVEALCLAFSTVSTGGFMTRGVGLGWLAPSALFTVTVFMFFSGVNVALLYRLFTLRLRHWWRNEELRTYTVAFLLSAVVTMLAFRSVNNNWYLSLHYSLFHVASTLSTCGYYLPRPIHWSFLVNVLTFLLILVGASAGSTGGGIKWRRVIIMAKYIAGYFTRMIHPHAVVHVKVDGQVVETDYINKVLAFVFLYIAFIVAGAFVLTLCGQNIPNAVCMAAANISNLGPSPLINNLGGSLDYALLPTVGKWTLMILMLAGRLELFALIAVFSPVYWRRG